MANVILDDEKMGERIANIIAIMFFGSGSNISSSSWIRIRIEIIY
jgi:hypothetical protein